MEIVNLLEFINNTKILYTLDYAECGCELVNFLDLMTEEEQFTRKIDLGILFVNHKTLDKVTIIDGLNRILSLSLLLHAICECYKKTTAKNDKAIRTIRNKYLLDGTKTRLRLPKKPQAIYEKIIYGERLSGREKEHPMFVLLHHFWTQIKEEKLQAGNIFKMLQKVQITVVDTENVSPRELYYSINKNNKEIDHLLLIENYMKETGIKEDWNELLNSFNNRKADIEQFFNDFFITKFNFKKFNSNRLYELYTNYFETMLMYYEPAVIMKNMMKSVRLYSDILNVNFNDKDIRDAFIRIRMHNGEDTYAYLLNIYEDYIENNITKSTFLEILLTIDDYLQKRLKTPNDVTFNELMQYLNAYLICK